MHLSNAQLPSLVKWLIFQIKFNIKGPTVSTCLTSAQISEIFSSSPLVDLCEQHVHDLDNVLDRHAPLISRLTKKDV